MYMQPVKAKKEKDNKWIEGFYAELPPRQASIPGYPEHLLAELSPIPVIVTDLEFRIYSAILPETLCIPTGHLSKDGTPIRANDILYSGEGIEFYTVNWCKKNSSFFITKYLLTKANGEFYYFDTDDFSLSDKNAPILENMSIVGNTIDFPTLLNYNEAFVSPELLPPELIKGVHQEEDLNQVQMIR